MDINERIGRKLSQLRDERGLSADELAKRSGVSRAMIYRIEAGRASPTAVVLNKLATGLGVLLPTLLGPGDYREPRLNLRHPVASRRVQATWQDPDTGYTRRTLTPSTADAPLEVWLGDETACLKGGDCMAMTLAVPITFHNPGAKDARCLIAVTRSGQ